MKKKYNPDENPKPGIVSEPMAEYGKMTVQEDEILYDIPKELLLKRIEQAEKDIAEGRFYTIEEAMHKILG